MATRNNQTIFDLLNVTIFLSSKGKNSKTFGGLYRTSVSTAVYHRIGNTMQIWRLKVIELALEMKYEAFSVAPESPVIILMKRKPY